MGKRYRWMGSLLLTAVNISLLLLTYYALVRLTSPGIPQPTPEQSYLMPNYPTPTPIPLVEIVQAYQNIPRGYVFPTSIEELTNYVGYTLWPEDAAPFNALTRYSGGLEYLLGKVARTDIFREQPILTNMLVNNPSEIANVGSDLAARLPADRVAKTIWMTRDALATGPVSGDHVNVFITHDWGEPGGVKTSLVVLDALVLWVGTISPDGRLPLYPTPTPYYAPTAIPSSLLHETDPIPIVLAVTEQDAAELIWAEQNQVPISLVLRAAADTSRVPVSPVGQETIPH